MTIQLPEDEDNLKLLATEVKAIAGYFAQIDSLNETATNRAKSAAEAIEILKAGEIKKLAKVFHLQNGQQLIDDATALKNAVDSLFEGEDNA